MIDRQEIATWGKSIIKSKCFVELNWWPRSCVASPRCEDQSSSTAAPAAYFAYFVFFHRNLIGEDSGTNCCPARYTIQLSVRLIFVLTNANTNTNTNANTIANTIANKNTNTGATTNCCPFHIFVLTKTNAQLDNSKLGSTQ